MQLSHGPYYTFYTLYLKQHEYAAGVIGQLWAVGVIAEVVVFLTMYKLGPMFGLRNLMLASLLLATLRWLLIAYFVESIIVMVFAQLLHAASFGMYHAVAIQMIHRLFVGKLQGRGQALYASFSFGAGGAVGSFYSGLLWDNLGSTMIYGIAASVSFVGFLVAWRWLAADAASQSEVPAKKSPG
jgi:PPP family 3-phenylpropionic acid transporter